MRRSVLLCIVAAAMGCSSLARAETVIVAGAFKDGGTYSGTYDLDATTSTITDWDISTYLPDGSLFEAFTAGVGHNASQYYSDPYVTLISFWDRGSLAPVEGSLSLLNFDYNVDGTLYGGLEIQGEGYAVLNANGAGASVSFGEEFSRSVVPNGPVPPSDPLFGSGAPEPSAWALMLLGFGGLGVAIRKRRNPQSERSRIQYR